MRDHLHHLGVDALPHLGSGNLDRDASIVVDRQEGIQDGAFAVLEADVLQLVVDLSVAGRGAD